MKVDAEGFELTHEEMLEWIRWHVAGLIEKRVPKDVVQLVGQSLLGFCAGAPQFVMWKAQENGMPRGVYCPKCKGMGHSNLFKIDGSPPEPCANCQGRGIIYPELDNQDLGAVDVKVKEEVNAADPDQRPPDNQAPGA